MQTDAWGNPIEENNAPPTAPQGQPVQQSGGGGSGGGYSGFGAGRERKKITSDYDPNAGEKQRQAYFNAQVAQQQNGPPLVAQGANIPAGGAAVPAPDQPGEAMDWDGGDVAAGQTFKAGDLSPFFIGRDDANSHLDYPGPMPEIGIPKDGSAPQVLGANGEQSYKATKAMTVVPNPAQALPPDLMRTDVGTLALKPDNPYLNPAGGPSFSEGGDKYAGGPSFLPSQPEKPSRVVQRAQAPNAPDADAINATLARMRGQQAPQRFDPKDPKFLSEFAPGDVPDWVKSANPAVAKAWTNDHARLSRTMEGRAALKSAFLGQQANVVKNQVELGKIDARQAAIGKRQGARDRNKANQTLLDQQRYESLYGAPESVTLGGMKFTPAQPAPTMHDLGHDRGLVLDSKNKHIGISVAYPEGEKQMRMATAPDGAQGYFMGNKPVSPNMLGTAPQSPAPAISGFGNDVAMAPAVKKPSTKWEPLTPKGTSKGNGPKTPPEKTLWRKAAGINKETGIFEPAKIQQWDSIHDLSGLDGYSRVPKVGETPPPAPQKPKGNALTDKIKATRAAVQKTQA